jgi:rSAM/selenodomain-associated transferase 1
MNHGAKSEIRNKKSEMATILGLFAKQPRPGEVKTRLAADTSAAFAAEIAEAFLGDLVERLAMLGVRRVLAFDPPEAAAYFTALAQGRFELEPQAAGDLGQRMAAFFRRHLEGRTQRVVLVGADAPTVPLDFIERAFAALQEADVVLGPATDGGYHLIGCRGGLPPVFDDIDWGTSRVLRQTVARLSGTNLRLALLPPWYDVDTLDGWFALCGHLDALRRAGVDPGVPRTESIAKRGPWFPSDPCSPISPPC